MPNLYRKDDEDFEGFGIVFIEAAACGKAVIGGKDGGSMDAVLHNRTGLLINSEDKNELVEAVHSLIKNPEWRNQLAANGKERAHRELNWSAVRKRFKDYIFCE